MAESKSEDGNASAAGSSESNSNWWGSWLNSAKTKSASVLEAVKKDIDELSTAVRTEVSNAGAAIDRTFKLDDTQSPVTTVKKSFSSFLGQMAEVLSPSPIDDDVEAVLITSDGVVTLTGFAKHLAELQSNDATYVVEPNDELEEKYHRWMEVVEQDQFTQDRLARHMASSEILNEKYLSLVPDTVPHMDFWKRYLFKKALLEDALANAELAERKAKTEAQSNKPMSPRKNIIQTEQPKRVVKDEELPETETVQSPEDDDEKVVSDLLKSSMSWETEKLAAAVELSEEEQSRILAEYEKELMERERSGSDEGLEENPTKLPAAKDTKKQKGGKQQQQTQQQKTKLSKGQNKNDGSRTHVKQDTVDKKHKTKTNKTENVPGKSETNRTTIKDDKKNEIDIKNEHFTKEDSDESWEKDFDL